MSNKKTVFSVSSGQYSDYRVHWLFENREDAERTARRVGGDIEEFDLYAPGSGDEISAYHLWIASATVNPVGQIEDQVHTYSIESFSDEEPEKPFIRAFPDQRWCGPDGTIHKGTTYQVRIGASDRETARKAAKERASKIAAAVAEGRKPDLTW